MDSDDETVEGFRLEEGVCVLPMLDYKRKEFIISMLQSRAAFTTDIRNLTTIVLCVPLRFEA